MTILNFILVRTLAAAAVVLGAGLSAQAQTWNGFYLGGQVGSAFLPDNADAFVTFDTDLDGSFGDTVLTAAGANAFSRLLPGVPAGVTPRRAAHARTAASTLAAASATTAEGQHS
jgi:hypothetical protein